MWERYQLFFGLRLESKDFHHSTIQTKIEQNFGGFFPQIKVCQPTLKKISEREDQYLYVARRTFTNLFLGVTYVYRDASSLKN
jgi:hypothetical protein